MHLTSKTNVDICLNSIKCVLRIFQRKKEVFQKFNSTIETLSINESQPKHFLGLLAFLSDHNYLG